MGHRAFQTSSSRARPALVLLCALLAAVAPAAAAHGAVVQPHWGQFAEIIFRHLTPDTGLPFTGATAIAQDRHGFLWIGSQSGLGRWDGQRFRVYQAADARSGLRDNLVKVLHVDTRGRLWVGTNAGGMARYDPGADRFIAYGAGPRGLSHGGVRAIADDGRGGLWVATSGGLDRVDPDARTIRRYRHGAAPGSLPADAVSALLRAPGGRLWVGSRAGLALLDPASGRFARVALPVPGGGAQPAISALVRDGSGTIWIGTTGAGAFRYDPRRGTIRAVAETDAPGAALATQTITSIAEARAGEVWIATAGKGIVIVDTAGGATRRIVHSAIVPFSLADDAPVALFRDAGGALWVGTQRGLSRHDPTRTGIWTLFGGTQRPGAIASQDVTALLGAADGRVWLGLRSHGVGILDPARGTIRSVPRRPSTPLAPIESLAELADGRVAIGTDAGLFVGDRAGAALARLGFGAGESARDVNTLLRDGSTLWIGRFDGLWRLTIGDGAHGPVRVPESDRLGDQRVMAIARAADGALWIGTQNGLNRLVPGSGTAQPIALGGGGADGLVPTVLADRRGRIWASVYGHGIALIEPRRGRPPAIRRIDVAQGLPDANVDMLIEDDAGRIWASTDDGLAVIDAAGAAVRALKAPDGVAIAAYWTGAGSRTATGQILFGGLGGVTVVDPRSIAAPAAPAPLVVTEVRVGGKPVADAGFNDRRADRRVTIAPDANRLFVEFASLDYVEPGSARYGYRLRGYQDDWTEADAAHRSASYTNLPPGDYVLEIRAAPAAGASAADPLSIRVTVLPAWYQTLWFRLALAGLCAAAVAAIIQLRTAVLRRQQRDLEQLVADRTAALRASQRELEQIAYIDVLTGLPNRRMFNDTLRTCLGRADRRGVSAALLLIDLDHFKAINDTHGHDAGDALLSEVALRLQGVVGEYDSLARLGGDEFAVIVHDASDRARIEHLCRRISESVAEPVLFKGLAIRSGASVGVALYKRHGTTSAELYKASDLALYAAKKRRRGSWAWSGDGSGAPPAIGASANRRSLR